ncbi:MAG: cobalamin B12-binding domain-containing protein [Desulfobacterales bacterium]
MISKRRIRILTGKMGLDAHYRGVEVLSMMLRDAGMEVIYTGLFQTAEMIVQTALQEDVDIIGLSFLSGEHLHSTQEVLNLLKAEGIDHLPVLVGGVIPKVDVSKLKRMGVCEVFRADTPIDEIIRFITSHMEEV